MGGILEYKGFYAIQNKTGSNRALRVGGTVVFRTGGWKARLERDNRPPIPISPLSPKFVLVVTAPTGNVTKQIDEVELEEYRDEHPSHEYYEVLFSVRNEDGSSSDDEPPPRILVAHPNGQSAGEESPA